MLDKTTGYNPETEALLDLSVPSLQALSHILRNKELWPEEFEWYFSDCDNCAMGLAHQLWYTSINYSMVSDVAPVFGMSIEAAEDIFYGWGDWSPKSEFKAQCNDGKTRALPKYDAITPEMVANRIDKYLAAKTE